jgi:hypothetical protein
LHHKFDLFKVKKCEHVLDNVEFNSACIFDGICNCDCISDGIVHADNYSINSKKDFDGDAQGVFPNFSVNRQDNISVIDGQSNSISVIEGENKFVGGDPQGAFNVFSVNRKDSISQLLASVHLDKRVNLVGNFDENLNSQCYFADCFTQKSALYFNNINTGLSHYVALLSTFCDLECSLSYSFINTCICTCYNIFGVNICTDAKFNIDLSEKIVATCCKPVITGPVLLHPLFSQPII